MRIELEQGGQQNSGEVARDLGLSASQLRVLQQLMEGESVAGAAAWAGVSRSTIFRWIQGHPQFQAAYNRWKREQVESARSRLLAMTDQAVTAVQKAVSEGDAQMAYRLLKDSGLTRPTTVGSSDPSSARREVRIRRKREEVKLRSAEAKLDLDLALPPAAETPVADDAAGDWKQIAKK